MAEVRISATAQQRLLILLIRYQDMKSQLRFLGRLVECCSCDISQLVSSSDADSPRKHAEKFGFSTNRTDMLCFKHEICLTGKAAAADLQINPAKITVTTVGTHTTPQLSDGCDATRAPYYAHARCVCDAVCH
jgi:hypothetical protein